MLSKPSCFQQTKGLTDKRLVDKRVLLKSHSSFHLYQVIYCSSYYRAWECKRRTDLRMPLFICLFLCADSQSSFALSVPKNI